MRTRWSAMTILIAVLVVIMMMFVGCTPGGCIGAFLGVLIMSLIFAAIAGVIPFVGPTIAIVVFFGFMWHAFSAGDSPVKKYCGCSSVCSEVSDPGR
ncbi:hypothetical protein COT97_00515 [Candidatus Falkowbacteria bacterium CG10_big_fil_rev_8_21_14_0_10_39_11]|uniref:Uncharacterized protein n=1 Tax=Candidatus Falkowbacteria bacterium CG10_big_fil_rev_8_21_14_0_10_39_11 TaxID=1974565 RepID=A0A2H0V6D3_9BACT|nr:MAG: hypothetical protein COT97_00515 [Candidatus Falkowbacteria bacterium CG10_big_fil_rev_8_21_14_0_10_39_11]